VINKADQIFLLEVMGERTTILFVMWSSLWLVTLGLQALCTSWKLQNVLNLMTGWWI